MERTRSDANTLEGSTFQRRPCYRYIRRSDNMPALYVTEHDDDPIARIHLFASAADWYLTEYDPEERRAFGWANLGDSENAELGYISMPELAAYRNAYGLPIERDLHFTPRPLSKCR